jgi:pilus assembly protein CpaE
VNDDAEEAATISDILSNVEYITLVGEAESAETALEAMDELYPDVILVGAYVPGDGYKLAEKIVKAAPEKAVIIVERELQEETMRKAIFAGAKDVLIYPFTPSKLVDSVYRSFQVEQKKQSIQRDRSPRERRKTRDGQILTVFSTKGGVGKTFIAANLAVALAQHTKGKVVLVDLDLDFGNAALALNIIPRYTISDVINEIRNLDQDLLESYLVPHRSGIMVLPANAQPQMTEFISADHVEIILKVLQSAFDYVVVDMPARFYSPVDPAFQYANALFLVTTPEVSTVRNVKAALVALNDLNYPKAKIKVLLNKADSKGEIKPKDVETTMNHDLYSVLVADHRLSSSSLNKGIPVVMLYPRAKISKNFEELARKISGDDQRAQGTA